MKLHLQLRILSIILIVASFVGLAPLNYFWLQSKIALAQHSGVLPTQPLILKPSPTLVIGRPVEIAIPSLHIDLQVIPGTYDQKSGEWTLSLDKAHFAEPSVQPNNEAGNTLIYGHYRPQVFAYLHLIKPGAQAFITTQNGYIFSYTFQNSQPLEPSDTSIFAYRGIPRLTIQTCSGSFMQHRQMYYFQYDGFKKQ